ncbi:MAG: hypothetical protein HY287_14410 [Planctomycetes bacterium]|nr:hypothetical protein [Planctomycetota bacterium]MBI3835515.1 hypothetical protein [Planctomycetota bacterium]
MLASELRPSGTLEEICFDDQRLTCPTCRYRLCGLPKEGTCPECGTHYLVKQFEIETFLKVVHRCLPRGWRPALRFTNTDESAPLIWLIGTALLLGFGFAYSEYFATYVGLRLHGGGGEHVNFIAEFGYYGYLGPKVRVAEGALLTLAILTTIEIVLMASIVYVWYLRRAARPKSNSELLRHIAISAAAGVPRAVAPSFVLAVLWQVLNCSTPSGRTQSWLFHYSMTTYLPLFSVTDWVGALSVGVLLFGVASMIRFFVIHLRALREISIALEPIQVRFVSGEKA